MRIAVAFFAVTFAALGQHAHPVEDGKALYQKKCVACHGENGAGGRGPTLASGAWHWGSTDADLTRNIVKGIPGTQMPAIAMPESDAAAIVAYLRDLRGDGAKERSTGDPESGRKLFFGTASCSHCHMFGGAGGRLGPDLSGIRADKKIAEIRKAILDPNQSIRPGFDRVTMTLKTGRTVTGLQKSADTFSVLVMDLHEGIHSIPKAQIGKKEYLKTSLMAAPKLRASEVEDLVALLTAEAPPAIPLPEWKPTASLNLSAGRIQNSRQEPANWLTYWGHYDGSHYSLLNSITPANVKTLASQWSWQFAGTNVETTPIVADGIMYITGPKNDAAALDARTGLPLWRYSRRLPEVHSQCTVMTNRGFAMLGDRLYMGTLDAHLVALDARTGSVIWDVAVEDFAKGFSITQAPLAIDGKIIVGITSGECALTGFIDAYDAASGKRIWRVPTVAPPGDPNRASWSGDSANYGGSPTWMTGTFDAASNTLYWTTGNPGPDFDGSVRQGDNLYSDSVLALDPATGNRKWYFQFTQHDTHDWDANETPVLIDAVFEGKPRKLLIQANRNAFYYVLDRETGQFLAGRAFARQTWAKGLDAKGHPIVIPNTDPTPEGVRVCPDASGATNWAAPSYDAQTKLVYVSVREVCALYTSITRPPAPGESYTGGGSAAEDEKETPGSIRALDPLTGKTVWNFPMQTGSAAAGVLSTAGGVLFAATSEGNLIALNAKTGAPLWHYQVGGAIQSAPISYAVEGRQYIAIATDSTLVTFALPEAVTP